MAIEPKEHGSSATATAMEADARPLLSFRVQPLGATSTAPATTSSPTTIGTHESNTLVLKDPTVSRFHCELTATPAGPRLRDVGSRNGTFLDGIRVFDAIVRDGAIIRVGESSLQVTATDETLIIPLSERGDFGSLAGESPAIRATFALLEAAAASDATVLLEGESGTGKEGAAQSLHELGTRKPGPFVVVDCGAIPAELLESELFGHEKGAFTGADARRIGAFEEASGGTLFLDELGELPLDMQPKLLRALEQRQVRRVGSNSYRPIDVRVIAATNRDLRELVNDGRFRADLYFRLAVIKVRLPPLRERPEDVQVIARRLLAQLGADEEMVSAILAPRELGRMQAAAWPGNVRELRNYLERCLVFKRPVPLASGGEITGDVGSVATRRAVRIDAPYEELRRLALDEWEAAWADALLREHEGNVERAAKAAGLGRAHMYRLVSRHGLIGRHRPKRR